MLLASFFKGEYFVTVQKNQSTHIALGIDIGYDPGQERFDCPRLVYVGDKTESDTKRYWYWSVYQSNIRIDPCVG